jgi:hypothetical protein
LATCHNNTRPTPNTSKKLQLIRNRNSVKTHVVLKLQSLLALFGPLGGAFESIVSMIFSHKLHATKKVRGKLSSNPVLPGLIPFLFAVAV